MRPARVPAAAAPVVREADARLGALDRLVDGGRAAPRSLGRVDEWRRRSRENGLGALGAANDEAEETRSREVGQRLDTLGPGYRLPLEKQERMEELLARQGTIPLAPAERHELEALIAECDQITLRRAQALRYVL